MALQDFSFVSKSLTIVAAAGLLAACSVFESKEAPPLPGERISIMALQKDLVVDVSKENLEEVEIPEVWNNQYWPQAGGYPNHSMQNLALAEGPLERKWRTGIGEGSSDEIPLTTQPVVVGGMIYTLDTDAELRAFDTANGDLIWSTEIRKDDEDEAVIPGGIAFGDNTLFVTSGYNEILAVDPKTGEDIWRKTLAAPTRAAPSILDGQVYVLTLDNRLLALSARDGSFLWDYQGINESSGLVGAASPALDNEIVVAAFSSGEVTALRVTNGAGLWSENLANVRGLGGLAGIADIRGLPVIDQDMVFAISFGGKMVAIDQRTGQRVWQRDIGGSETPWVAGNYVYVLSSSNQLVALTREKGAIRWVTDLPNNDDGDPIRLTGPIMAGGRLIVNGTDGRVFEVNPENGEILSEWDSGQTVLIPPVVAGGTLYLLQENGTLLAYE